MEILGNDVERLGTRSTRIDRDRHTESEVSTMDGYSKLEVMLSDVRKDVEALEKKVNNQQEDFSKFKTDFAVIAFKLTNFEGLLLEIKSDVKGLSNRRDEDHYVRPLERSERLAWLAIATIVGILLTILMQELFPQL